jgi:PrtD family type I secretion system ABC transporter
MMRDPGTIAALGMRGAMRTLWMRRNDSALISQAAASHRATELLAVAKFLRMSVQIAVMSVAAYLVVEKAIQPGMIFAASLLIGRVLAPVEQAVGSWRRFVAARHAFTSLKPLLSAAPEGERIDLPAPTGRIGVERLQVAHPGAAEPVLKEVSFALDDGETLLIVGPSGTGKSTLLRALLGIQPPSSGAVRLDGAALVQHDPECLGRHLGYVAQNVVLFEGTVAQNIARFRVADPDGVIAAAQAADAHEAILRLPRGYETEVGPAGEWLSGGMRQRIALARALYGGPILMVLDEPAFEADPAGDQALLRVLKQLKAEGKTVVVASHKTLLIPAADKILVLGNGAVQAFGPRDEILQKALRPRVVAASGMVAAPTGLAESRGEQAGTMGGQPDLRTVM